MFDIQSQAHVPTHPHAVRCMARICNLCDRTGSDWRQLSDKVVVMGVQITWLDTSLLLRPVCGCCHWLHTGLRAHLVLTSGTRDVVTDDHAVVSYK